MEDLSAEPTDVSHPPHYHVKVSYALVDAMRGEWSETVQFKFVEYENGELDVLFRSVQQ